MAECEILFRQSYYSFHCSPHKLFNFSFGRTNKILIIQNEFRMQWTIQLFKALEGPMLSSHSILYIDDRIIMFSFSFIFNLNLKTKKRSESFKCCCSTFRSVPFLPKIEFRFLRSLITMDCLYRSKVHSNKYTILGQTPNSNKWITVTIRISNFLRIEFSHCSNGLYSKLFIVHTTCHYIHLIWHVCVCVWWKW